MSTSYIQALLGRIRLREVMTRWPEVCQYLTDRGMACVGCPMARFESVARVEEIYHIPRGELVRGFLEQRQSSAPARKPHNQEGTVR